MTIGNLKLEVVSAKLTRDVEMFGKMDPFVTLQYGKDMQKTTTHNSGGKTPVWKQTFDYEVRNLSDELTMTVWDEEQFSSPDLVGAATIKFSALCLKDGLDAKFAPAYKGQESGQVHLKGIWTQKDKPASKSKNEAGSPNPGKVVKIQTVQPSQSAKPKKEQDKGEKKASRKPSHSVAENVTPASASAGTGTSSTQNVAAASGRSPQSAIASNFSIATNTVKSSHSSHLSEFATKKMKIDLNSDASPLSALVAKGLKNKVQTVQETAWKKVQENAKIEEGRHVRRAESVENFDISEDVQRVGGTTIKTITTKKTVLKTAAVVEPPKVELATQIIGRKSRKQRTQNFQAGYGSRSPRNLSQSESGPGGMLSPKPLFKKIPAGQLNVSGQSQSVQVQGYASNVDRVKPSGIIAGGSAEYTTESEFEVRSGIKHHLRSKQRRDQDDPDLVQLVEQIFEKHDPHKSGDIQWPAGKEMILHWTKDSLKCKDGDEVVEATLRFVQDGDKFTKEELLSRLRDLKWWRETKEFETDTACGEHLESSLDIVGFPVFQRGQGKPLFSKVLTREMWKELMGMRDRYGCTFRDAIFSGCKHTDSAIGVFAGSPDSYETFGLMMTPLLEEYHKHELAQGHTTDMDSGHLHVPKFSQLGQNLIKSVKIAVSRNLAGFALQAGISKEKRLEVESKLAAAFKTFDGELSGRYHSLASLSENDAKALAEDNFLFKIGDRFQEAAGINRDWPEARGVFHNNDKTLLIWVNDEDQLKLMSMEEGCDIITAFSRLNRALSKIEAVADFAHSKTLGYITTRPSFIGTALRISMLVQLPHLEENRRRYRAICENYSIAFKSLVCNETQPHEHLYELSNRKRLGVSEVELLQDMYDCVKECVGLEREFSRPPDTACGFDLRSASDLKTFPAFSPDIPAKKWSLLRECLTRDMWDKYENEADASGYTFRSAIFPGCQNEDAEVGVYAGSEDSYRAFWDLYSLVIRFYHRTDLSKPHVSCLDARQLQLPAFTREEARYILHSEVRLNRNFAGVPFGPMMNRKQRVDVLNRVKKVCKSMSGDLEGKFYSHSTVSETKRQQLEDDDLLFGQSDRLRESAGFNRDWPEGRGIYHNNNKTLLVWVNEEDHVRIISMQKGSDVKAIFARLCAAHAEIEREAKYAQDPKLGYLTCCPSYLGTGLSATIQLNLPVLGDHMEEMYKIASSYGLSIRFIPSLDETKASTTFDVSTKQTLGASEVELLGNLMSGVKEMVVRERELGAEKQTVLNEEMKEIRVEQVDIASARGLAFDPDDVEVAYAAQYRESQMIDDFEARPRSENAFVWEISNTTKWRKTAQQEVQERLYELDMSDEIIFSFRLYPSKKASSAQNLAERLARIVLELPEKFAFKKVTILDMSILEIKTCQRENHSQFEWEKFLFYTQGFVFKELWINSIKRQGLPLLALLFTRTGCLFMKDCEMTASQGGMRIQGSCQLEEYSAAGCKVDLPSAGEYYASMRRIELNSAAFAFQDATHLKGMQHLTLRGSSSWQNIANFGGGLSSCKSLNLIFDDEAQANFEAFGIGGFAKLIPKGHVFEKISIHYLAVDFQCVLTKVLEQGLTRCSKATIIEMDALKLDAALEGLEKFPGEFFAKAVAHSSVWGQIQSKFKVVDYKIPALKSLQVYQEREGVYIEHHNPDERFWFEIVDKETGYTIRIVSTFLYGSDKQSEAKFLVQFLVFN